jgi:hypothetical protein
MVMILFIAIIISFSALSSSYSRGSSLLFARFFRFGVEAMVRITG